MSNCAVPDQYKKAWNEWELNKDTHIEVHDNLVLDARKLSFDIE